MFLCQCFEFFMIMIKNHLKIFFIALILLFALITYSYLIESNILKTKNLILKLDCLKSDLSNKKIVQISDLHFTTRTSEKKINKIYESIKAINPSMVFITGDFISEKNGIKPTIRLVKKISVNYPVYIVFGNWDYWATNYNIDEFKSSLKDAGAKTLINESVKINIGEETINLLGVKDPYTSGNKNYDLQKAMEEIKKNDKDCKILLAHSPDIIKDAAQKNIDLVLVGHTHGGQIYIPFITKKIIPSNPEGKGFIKGLYKIKDTLMYVNRGIGGSVLPLRFLVFPEITVLTLKR